MRDVVRFLMSHWVLSLCLIVVGGVVYKYDRQLFFRGDYEVTYIPLVLDKSCSLNECGPGYKVELVNTGHEQSDNVVVEVDNIPDVSGMNIEVKQGYFPAWVADDKPVLEPLPAAKSYSLRLVPSTLHFEFPKMPPLWHITIVLSTSISSGSPVSRKELEDIVVRISGRGSFLMENPYKVVVAQKVSDVLEKVKHRTRGR